jgi:hypothetical protein
MTEEIEIHEGIDMRQRPLWRQPPPAARAIHTRRTP